MISHRVQSYIVQTKSIKKGNVLIMYDDLETKVTAQSKAFAQSIVITLQEIHLSAETELKITKSYEKSYQDLLETLQRLEREIRDDIQALV